MTAARLLPDPAATNRKAIEGLDIAVTALALHCDNKFTAVKAVKQSPYSAKGGTWTATSSVAEPAAPEPCTSPRIGAVPAAAGLAALQRQHSTPCKTIAASTHSVRTKAAVQPLRKSADAIPTRKTSKTVTASPLRQSRRQSSLSRSGGSTNLSPEEARIAAIRRSRVSNCLSQPR